jgi:hypothetical protein
MTQETLTLGQRISKITEEIGSIKKKKEQGGPQYAFRSIDDFMNKLSPLLAKHEVTLTSKVLSFTLNSRTYTKWDNYQKKDVEKFAYYATVHLAVLFNHGDQSETWEEPAMSEDNSDKAITQAMSMAYKYAIARKFCVATEDIANSDGDRKVADAFKEEPKEAPKAVKPAASPTKEFMTKEHPLFEKTKDALMKGMKTVDNVKTVFNLSDEMEKELNIIVSKSQAARVGGGK